MPTIPLAHLKEAAGGEWKDFRLNIRLASLDTPRLERGEHVVAPDVGGGGGGSRLRHVQYASRGGRLNWGVLRLGLKQTYRGPGGEPPPYLIMGTP